ncbi:membrane dipeptidase [Rhodobacteraceae bacterium R_SAG2]|nr:membrane dipeptidase [Rhodobacteraceae bacterium R_SAG2]
MSSDTAPLVFDGHNDALLRLWKSGQHDAVGRFVSGDGDGHIDLPRASEGRLGGGLCAIYVPSERVLDDNGNFPTPTRDEALDVTMAQAGLLARIEREAEGAFTICRTTKDIRDSLAKGSFAGVMHLEGAEAITTDLDLLYALYNMGLRTLGPVWSRPNIFAFGVPFQYPSSPDLGPGLSSYGKALVRSCNELGIMIDLSHLNEAGFWDVANLSDAPLVASHSNVHAICSHSRNVTDRQLDAIRDSGGLIGINFGVSFLHPEGERYVAMELSMLVQHVNYIVDRIGIDHVAFGSDFDGTRIPDAMRDVRDLPKLIAALKSDGYRDSDIEKIANGNWLRVLEQTWGA